MLRQRIHSREKILRSFEDIPLIFSKACDTFNNHPGDGPLHECVEGLYDTLKDEILKLTEILNRQQKGSCESTELVL